jgi:hypothetical protein
MNRHLDADFDQRVADWLEEDPTHAPREVLGTVLAAYPSIPQRRATRMPWRFPPVFYRLGTVAAVVAVVIGGILLLGRPGPSIGGPASPTPSPSPTSKPSPSATVVPTALPAFTQAFTSARHGYRISYPAGWTVAAATAPWPMGIPAADPTDPMLDAFTLSSGGIETFVGVSQPVPSGTTATGWLTAYEASAPQMPAACWPAPGQMEQIRIDGQKAWVHGGVANCGFTEAVVFAGGRVYEFTGYVRAGIFDRTFFNAWIASIHLDPASADDTPVASPRPS